MGPSPIDLSIRYFGIVLSAYIVLLNFVQDRRTTRRFCLGIAAVALISVLTGCIYNYLPGISIFFMFLLFGLIMGKLFGLRAYSLGTNRNPSLTLLSFGISYAAYCSAVLWTVFLLFLNKTAVAGRFERSVDAWIYTLHYVTSFKGIVITRSFILAFQLVFLWILLRNKRVKKALPALLKANRSDVMVFIWVAVILFRSLFLMSVFNRHDSFALVLICLYVVILLLTIFFFWLKKEIRSTYKIKIQESELSLLEKSLDSKETLFNQMRGDNECLAEIIHKDNKLIPSMVMSVRQASEEMSAGNDGDGCIAKMHDAADSLADIYSRRIQVLDRYGVHAKKVFRTGVTAADAVLLYLSSEADAAGVDFSVQINADLPALLKAPIRRGEFVVLLADLAEYAIVSVKEKPAGAVAVDIGQEDGCFCLQVSDNGNRLDAAALKGAFKRRLVNLSGKGIPEGSARVFGILRNSDADFTLEEFPETACFTKAIRIAFDGEGKLRIVTDRAREVSRAVGGRFQVVQKTSESTGEYRDG